MCKDNNLFFYTVSADICFRDNKLFIKRKKESLAGDSFLFLSLKNFDSISDFDFYRNTARQLELHQSVYYLRCR